jgi:PEP-CTERM motif
MKGVGGKSSKSDQGKLSFRCRAAVAGIVLAIAAAASLPSQAATKFDFTFTTSTPLPTNGCCGPFDVTAQLVGNLVGSSYQITGISGTVTEGSNTYAITGMIPPPLDPAGTLGFDNLVNTTAGHGPYSLDTAGLGFYSTAPSFYAETNADPSLSLSAFNIYQQGGYILSTTASNDVNTTFNGTASITAVPEPATWAVILVGFGGLGVAMRQSRRRRAASFT